MAAFINNDITATGLIVLAKGLVGGTIRFTKIVLGDGYIPEGSAPRSMNDVVSPKAVVDISKLKLNPDGTVVVGGIFNNRELNDGFYYRELGLYVEDPDQNAGEVLYCYGNAGDTAEWIPPTGGSTILEKTIDIITVIGNAANVTAYIPADAYVTRAEYDNVISITINIQKEMQEAVKVAENAVSIAYATQLDLEALAARVARNESRIQILWDAVFSNITTNPFLITFADLDGITLTSGVWNTSRQRLEC